MTFRILRQWTAMLLLSAVFYSGSALATVELRVEARPIADPIQAFITVTDANGDPVGGLTAASFTVNLDGDPLTIAPGDLTLPPAQDPNQKVSVAFAMDYSDSVTVVALDAMRNAVIAFIDAMNAGDAATVIKFNADTGAAVVLPFTLIDDGGAGDIALTAAVNGDYPGNGTNLLDAINLAVDQFVTPAIPLPDGPKAIIVVSDGGENESTATATEVIANANANSIPVFGVGVGDFTLPGRTELMTDLGVQTGGDFLPAPNDAEIAAAYVTIKELLSNEYLLSIPSAIADCAEHTLEVAVTGQALSASATFTRQECDTSPNPFTFTSQTDVTAASDVTSNEVTITGIEVPTPISVRIGRYSIGCGTTNADFTDLDGTVSNGDTLCLRHSAHPDASTSRVTTLTVGDFSTTFTSTTSATAPPPPPGGGGGGGGATGFVELLLGLAALLGRRRRPA
ncbi:MAG: VWA domain-containing protein [Steroidobacteraceae bacterium]